MLVATQPTEIMGIAPYMDFMTRSRSPQRTAVEIEALLKEHEQLIGKPESRRSEPCESPKVVAAELQAKRRAGRRAFERVGRIAASRQARERGRA